MNNLTPRDLKWRMIVSAALPIDDNNEIEAPQESCSGYRGIAVLPTFVKDVRANLPSESDCNLVGLVAYPFGGVSCNTKVTEIRQLVYQGCDAFNIIANTALMLNGDWEEVECDLISVVKSASGRPVTKTIEAAYLNEEQIRRMVEICLDCGVEAISTTTGCLPNVPDIQKISLIKSIVGDSLLIEAGGILSYDQFMLAADAGADRFNIRRQTAEAILAQVEQMN